MKRVQQGFTLIELMIVVAIIGILAAVAIPQYQNYVLKAKIGNALTAVDSIKTAVAQCVQENGGSASTCSDTANSGAAGVIPVFNATKEVASVTVIAGEITATLAADLGSTDVNSQTITFTPNVSGGTSITWGIGTSVTNATIATMITKNSASGT